MALHCPVLNEIGLRRKRGMLKTNFLRLILLVLLSSISIDIFAESTKPQEIIIHGKYTWLIKRLADEGFYSWPSISPDSSYVVFTMRNMQEAFPLNDRLYVLNIKTKKITLLTPSNFPYRTSRPDWSLTNHLIAFTAQMKNDSTFIATINVQNPQQIQTYLMPVEKGYTSTSNQLNKFKVTESGYLYPSWFPGGTSFAVMYSNPKKNLFINRYYNIKNKSSKNLTDPNTIFAGMSTVSPNGKMIVFAGQEKSPVYDELKNKIWIKALNKKVRLLNVTQGRTPGWSPDGKWVLYESNYVNKDGGYSMHIQKASGEGPIYNILLGDNLFIRHPKWSPNGKFIIADVIKHENGSPKFQQADHDYLSASHSEISGLIKVTVPAKTLEGWKICTKKKPKKGKI
jgi:Tol biopolymer transport system component